MALGQKASTWFCLSGVFFFFVKKMAFLKGLLGIIFIFLFFSRVFKQIQV